jgi:hypothetical protein
MFFILGSQGVEFGLWRRVVRRHPEVSEYNSPHLRIVAMNYQFYSNLIPRITVGNETDRRRVEVIVV